MKILLNRIKNNKILCIIGLVSILILIYILCRNNLVENFENNNIPKVIHKVLIQDDGKIPKNLDKNIKDAHNSWKEMNPDYKIIYWSLNDCREYLKNNFPSSHLESFDCIQAYANKCDFFRYCIIYNEGGWYSDWKQICLVKNLLNNIGDNKNFVYFFDNGWDYSIKNKCIQNGFFGSIPKHPILKKCIDIVINNVKNKFYGKNGLEPTGPYVLGTSIKDNNINVNKKNYFQNNYYYHNKLGKIIQHKCNNCGLSQNWKNGNNYNKLWDDRKYYCND